MRRRRNSYNHQISIEGPRRGFSTPSPIRPIARSNNSPTLFFGDVENFDVSCKNIPVIILTAYGFLLPMFISAHMVPSVHYNNKELQQNGDCLENNQFTYIVKLYNLAPPTL